MPRGVYIRTEECREAVRAGAMKRPPVSDKTKTKMRVSQQKRREDPADRAKTSAGINRHYLEHPETRDKLRIRAEKRWEDPAEHVKHSVAQQKRREDPADRAKTSASMKKVWADLVFRNSMCGENSWAWLGGISLVPYPFDFSKDLKDRIRDRDGYTCGICKIPEEHLDRALSIHHIDYDKENIGEENLLSLCRSCHAVTNFNREYWKNTLSGADT